MAPGQGRPDFLTFVFSHSLQFGQQTLVSVHSILCQGLFPRVKVSLSEVVVLLRLKSEQTSFPFS